MEKGSNLLNPMRVSLDDIERALSLRSLKAELDGPSDLQEFGQYGSAREKPPPPYIKVTLRKTAEIVLYEHRSMTAFCGTEEGKQVEQDNERYDYLTVGPGRRRRTIPAQTQTAIALYKTRDVNTERICTDNVGCYVSNFEMFDTYKYLESSTQSIEVDGKQTMDVTTYTVHGVDTFVEISKAPSFKLALMLTLRLLAGNIYEQQQRRFRNMIEPDPLAGEVSYRYRLQLLWRFEPELWSANCTRRQVTDFSWCPQNGDILAISYGLYTFQEAVDSNDGYVCVWNIKNPVNPERFYHYKVPVITVEFSMFEPTLLAVGLFDGTIEVLNISNAEAPPIATTDWKTLRNCEPIVAIKWLPHDVDYEDKHRLEPFLALTRDSSVTKYSIINSSRMLAQPVMLLERLEAKAEGVSVERTRTTLLSNRHPQGLSLYMDPVEQGVYYVLTDEGCRHKCSTNYSMQHLEVLQVHEAGANAMEYSPWSTKLFLTCGNDWCINIWLEGILEPVITLKHGMEPVHAASWSKTHSTVIVSLNRSTVNVWDLRRSTLKPMSSTNIDQDFHTHFKFTQCGRSIVVGNEAGNVLMCALEDMPFPPYYQFKQLERAIYKIIQNDREMVEKVKNVGFFDNPQ